jgi:hypothetical protein
MTKQKQFCVWVRDCGAWATSCDHVFEIIDGTPTENGMKYCCFCGCHLSQLDDERKTTTTKGNTND